MRVWIPSPPQRVIGPAAYYPLEGGGIMKEPPPSLIVAGLANFVDWTQSLTRTLKPHMKRKVTCMALNFEGYDSYFILEECYQQYMGLWLESC